MLLHDLPGAILRQIFNGEDSFCAIELRKCGDRTMNARLANKGVVHFQLSDQSPFSTSRWPRCLREFELEKLSIDRGHYPLGAAATLQNEFKRLSSSLRVLEIRGCKVAKALFPPPSETVEDVSDDASELLDRPLKRSKTSEIDDASQLRLSSWDLNLKWPHLERLLIKDLYSSEFDSSLFKLLPRSLKFFEFYSRFNVTVIQDLSGLPSGLETLLLYPGIIGLEGVLTLPKSLISVGDSLNFDALAKVIEDPTVLPSLQVFHCRELEGSTTHPLSLLERGLSLPKTLLEVELNYYSPTNFFTSKLPPYLTSLSCSFEARVGANEIACLPNTLTKLKITSIEWQEIEQTDWPSTQQQLHIRTAPLNHLIFFALPRSLTHLQITYGTIPPYNLEVSKIKAVGRQYLAKEIERWSIEKEKLLRELSLDKSAVESYIARVEDGELFSLPVGLVEFIIPEPLPPHLLPPLIQRHNMCFLIQDGANALNTLPPSNTLHASITLLGATENAADVESFSAALSKAAIASITLEVEYAASLCNFKLQYLPRALRFLELKVKVKSSQLKHLPPHLEKFDIGTSDFDDDEDDWVQTLPRSLKTIVMRKARIYGTEIALLPPNLEYLHATVVYVTLAQARSNFPPRIRTVLVCNDDRAPNSEYLSDQAWQVLRKLCQPLWRIRGYSEAFLAQELAWAQTIRSITELALEENDIDPCTRRRFAIDK